MSNIRNNIATSAVWSTVMAFSRVGLQFLSTVVLAHLLSPDDFGLIGMMAIFIAISETVMDAGLGGALIRKKNATAIDYGTLFTYNTIMSLTLYLTVFLIAPYVAEFYEKPILTTLMRLYGCVLVIDALAIVPKVRMVKSLKIKQYAIINLVAGTSGLLSAIIMARNGLGVYSLIYQSIIGSAVYSILLLVASRYRLRFCFSVQSFRELFGFGFNTTSANLIKSFAENIFTNVVAKIAPLSVTGYYNQSFKLQNVVASVQTTVIDNALFPVLSKEEDKKIIDVSLHINYLAAYVVVIIHLLLIYNSHLIVKLMMGEEWIEMVPYLKLLLIGGVFQSFTAFNRNIFKTLAETRIMAFCEIISLSFLVILFVAMRHGVYFVVLTYIGYTVFRWQVSLCLLAKNGHVDYFRYMKHFSGILVPIAIFASALACITFIPKPIINGLIRTTLLGGILLLYGEKMQSREYLMVKEMVIKCFKRKS